MRPKINARRLVDAILALIIVALVVSVGPVVFVYLYSLAVRLGMDSLVLWVPFVSLSAWAVTLFARKKWL